MNRKKYLVSLQEAILKTHNAKASYLETVPVKETFSGKTVWEGDVEVFSIVGHPKAKKCYAWQFKNEKGKDETIAVIDLPPVDSPSKAVQAYIVSRFKQNK